MGNIDKQAGVNSGGQFTVYRYGLKLPFLTIFMLLSHVIGHG